MSSESLSPLLGILVLSLPFIIALIQVAIDRKKFFLANSRQFVMNAETADSHYIRKEGDGQVSMEYYDKRYMYKCIRVVDKDFRYYGRHHRRYYFILEKMTDEQPPHYSHMDEMQKKESNK